MGYKILGYVVWHGARFYVRRRYGHLVPSRTAVLSAGVGAVVVVALVRDERFRATYLRPAD